MINGRDVKRCASGGAMLAGCIPAGGRQTRPAGSLLFRLLLSLAPLRILTGDNNRERAAKTDRLRLKAIADISATYQALPS